MKAKDVFTPGKFPTVTFINDHLAEKGVQLRDALEEGSVLISISGPSKSGKTVFVEHLIGRAELVQVTGAGVDSASALWMKVFDIIGTPVKRIRSESANVQGSVSSSVSGEGGFVLAKAKAGFEGTVSVGKESSRTEEIPIDLLQLLVSELANSDFVVFIDDFHYIPKPIQVELARQMKEAIRQGIKIIVASVPYHADDVIRGNPDLRGRIFSIDFDFWGAEILSKIAYRGFKELNVGYRRPMVDRLVQEAAGSPQLMQYLCLNACYEIGVRETVAEAVDLPLEETLLGKICSRTVLSTDYGSVFDRMLEGPKTRGSDRKIHLMRNNGQGDVYCLLLKAIALNPPQLTFQYQNLLDRIQSLCVADSPSGSSITSACFHSTSIGNDTAGDKIIEWDGEHDVLDIRDPYLLFFLRWSDRA